ncbi:MAG: EamA family transporter [Mailhella sp.]|nr:EamA family transporter [Mailhella sp.]
MQTFSLQGCLLVLAGALCFSTTGFTQALIACDGATPYAIGALRMLIGGAGLLALCAFRGNLPSLHGWPLKNLALAVLGVAGYQICFFHGTLQAGVAIGTLAAMGFTPIVAAILGIIFLKSSPSREWYFSTALALAGLALLNWGKADDFSLGALLFPLASGAAYGIYLTFSGPLLHGRSSDVVMTAVLLLSGLAMLPGLMTEDLSWVLSPKGVIACLHLGLVTTALGYLCTLAGLSRTTPAIAATLSLAEPVCAAMLGILCLGEPVTGTSFSGIILILSSTLLLVVLPALKRSAGN